MTNKTENNIPDSILKLIPWFSINKLSIEDQTVFENALRSHPSLQQQVEDERQMIEMVSADNSILDKRVIAAPEERLKAVFNMIDSPDTLIRSKVLSKSSASNTLLKKLKSSFNSFTTNQGAMQQYARLAGVAGLVLSVAVLTTFAKPLFTTHSSDFIPASAVTQPNANQASLTNSTETILLVGFSGSSDELSNLDILKGKQINIESPPDKDGFFQISFKQTMNADEIKNTIDALLSHEETIWFAGEAF